MEISLEKNVYKNDSSMTEIKFGYSYLTGITEGIRPLWSNLVEFSYLGVTKLNLGSLRVFRNFRVY